MQTKIFTTKIFSDRAALGRAAAADVADAVQKLLAQKESIAMIFAAAPSQNEFLAAFCDDPGVDFSRIDAFHMDEYIGLDPAAPQGFGNFLRERLLGRRPFRSVHYLNGNAPDLAEECCRYSALLRSARPDIVCLGIGENGHIAFNDPPVADFRDPLTVKAVKLDERCRRQQVNDGCFAALEEVPRQALTLTIPALVTAERHFCIVPSARKAEAVHRTIYDAIREDCPSTILRLCPNVTLYLDAESNRTVRLPGLAE